MKQRIRIEVPPHFFYIRHEDGISVHIQRMFHIIRDNIVREQSKESPDRVSTRHGPDTELVHGFEHSSLPLFQFGFDVIGMDRDGHPCPPCLHLCPIKDLFQSIVGLLVCHDVNAQTELKWSIHQDTLQSHLKLRKKTGVVPRQAEHDMQRLGWSPTLHQNISTNSPNNGLFRRLFRESSKLVFISHYLRDYLETGYYTRLFGDFLQITC
jgi:hypothetical protein